MFHPTKKTDPFLTGKRDNRRGPNCSTGCPPRSRSYSHSGITFTRPSPGTWAGSSTVKFLRSFRCLPPAGVFESTHAGTTSTDRRLRQTELTIDSQPSYIVSSLLPEIEGHRGVRGDLHPCPYEQDELLLIDQHAAHERILYEQVSGFTKDTRPSQELISPVILHRTPKEVAILRDLLPALAGEGFVLEEFGGDSFLVRAVPVVLGRLEEATIIDEIISDLMSKEPRRP